jgi:hypothetical protein
MCGIASAPALLTAKDVLPAPEVPTTAIRTSAFPSTQCTVDAAEHQIPASTIGTFNAVALDDIEDGILAQPEPVADFAVRLSFADEL